MLIGENNMNLNEIPVGNVLLDGHGNKWLKVADGSYFKLVYKGGYLNKNLIWHVNKFDDIETPIRDLGPIECFME